MTTTASFQFKKYILHATLESIIKSYNRKISRANVINGTAYTNLEALVVRYSDIILCGISRCECTNHPSEQFG